VHFRLKFLGFRLGCLSAAKRKNKARQGGTVPAALFDIAIIGGGINGCGIARDAAGRGHSVYLCEKCDLAGGTSSKSTKLIHGGLRYLEYYEFRLVREALMEREVLLRAAPHIIRPLRFVLPHHGGLRPAWLIRLGLFLYDHLGGRDLLPPARRINLARDAAGEPLKPKYSSAFEYSDCWVDDSRLVVLNAIDAAERGAIIETRTEMVRAERRGGAWQILLKDSATGAERAIAARVLVNASGPWVGEVTAERLGLPVDAPVRLVKGSHIVVKRLFRHDRAYIFQQTDGRIVFAIPYEGDFTLIGTTDLDYDGNPGDAFVTEAEIDYLSAAASEYFQHEIAASEVVHSYAGVRPLYDDGASEAQAATRDYVLKLYGGADQPPLLSIIGGKITTYRRLAEAALAKLAEFLPARGKPWTAEAPLPGGDFPIDGLSAQVARLRAFCPACPPAQAERLARAYGTRARRIVEGARSGDDFGTRFGADLTEHEVRYLMEREWARTADDVLWRRSKLGLHFSGAEARRLDDWMRMSAAALPEPAAAMGGGAR
jgi:glycerol-3-phosphate dehydrogenase